MAPQFAKPYVKTNKNDAADAEAICEAVARPIMRFVLIKCWQDTMSLVNDLNGRRVFRITCGDPDEKQRCRLIHPGQTLLLINPDRHPAIVVEVDDIIWRRVHGQPMAWRIFLPDSQPIASEWRFEEWCSF